MIFEDGTPQTNKALQLLQSQKDALHCPELSVQTVPDFLLHAKTMRLSRRDKEILVEQAILLIDQFYAHLPFKRARYATDPVQHFRLIHAQIDHLTDLEFHGQMIRAFMRLRDAHTFYGLPAPFRGAFAFLPFRMDYYYDGAHHRRFVVTNILEGFDHPHFGVGAEITLWSGMPVERAIERESEFEPGCNSASRFVRGIRRLTKRSLTFSSPPDEEFVVVRYLSASGGHQPYSIVLPWSIATACIPFRPRQSPNSSFNEALAELKLFGDTLWKRPGSNQTIPSTETIDLRVQSAYPEAFAFQYSGGQPWPGCVDPGALLDADHPLLRFGYIQIKTFDLESGDPSASDGFFNEFTRILSLMQEVAPDGLVLDVRSNPGGSIEAAERILQLLTPQSIEPARFHFINSQFTQQIASHIRDAERAGKLDDHQREWLPWIEDLLAAVTSGHFVTPGRPLTSPDWANDTGQCYQGPVTLVIDASSYSATDIFAAGFQDHQIGAVIGVDQSTGGGGANRWLHEDLRQLVEKIMPGIPFRKLPGVAQMGLALRRSSRAGRNVGLEIEDEGVSRDIAYAVTRNDVLNRDQDLIRFACAHLGKQHTGKLEITKAELRADHISVSVNMRNVYRLECLVNGRPQCSFGFDSPQPLSIPIAGLTEPPSLLQIDGFAMVTRPSGVQQLQLIARETFRFQPDIVAAAGAMAAS